MNLTQLSASYSGYYADLFIC